jgi:UDP-2,3-diacylglucosamine hydrolase
MNVPRPTLLISDLHLCEERPALTDAFLRFCDHKAEGCAALYILGDLFEVWLGDDQLEHDPLARRIAVSLATLAGHGTPVFFMHGNRDFLIGERFARDAGLCLLGETHTIERSGEKALLMHGDALCTDDLPYQQFRTMVRASDWQRAFLSKPYAERAAIARSLRTQSDVEKSMKAEAIMDANELAVRDVFNASGCTRLIHGHTHRPARHVIAGSDGTPWVRDVLPDWRRAACGLEWHEGRWAAFEERA